ncbi:MAG: hypothetical protein BWY39_01163 [Spirochaetes bacterium ADurb.Bin269]|nr:MAG: hypothetical protein BWY39_01163 [Spirochaetes bacterium ADurb.Bin269]
MVVRLAQAGDLPIETLTTFAVALALVVAPAVATPIADGVRDVVQFLVIRAHRAALAGGDVVRRIEAKGGEMAERAATLAIVAAAERVAGILDHVEVVRLREVHHAIHLHRIAEDVRDENGARLLRERGLQ